MYRIEEDSYAKIYMKKHISDLYGVMKSVY